MSNIYYNNNANISNPYFVCWLFWIAWIIFCQQWATLNQLRCSQYPAHQALQVWRRDWQLLKRRQSETCVPSRLFLKKRVRWYVKYFITSAGAYQLILWLTTFICGYELHNPHLLNKVYLHLLLLTDNQSLFLPAEMPIKEQNKPVMICDNSCICILYTAKMII